MGHPTPHGLDLIGDALTSKGSCTYTIPELKVWIKYKCINILTSERAEHEEPYRIPLHSLKYFIQKKTQSIFRCKKVVKAEKLLMSAYNGE